LDTENYQKVRIQNTPKFTTSLGKTDKLQETFTLEYHLGMADDNTKSLFESLKEQILAIDKEIIEDPKKLYVAYKTTRNFVDVVIKKSKLKLYINMKTGSLDDPRGVAKDLESPVHIGHWGNGDYEVEVTSKTDLDYVMNLIQQSYDINQ
jgi:predicted transport protein